MANAVLWSAYSAALAKIINGNASTPTAKNLANGGLKTGNEIDNTSGRHRYISFRLRCRGASAFTAGGYVALFLPTALDGTNYEDGTDDAITPSSNSCVRTFPLRAVSTQQVIDFVNILTPGPVKFKPVILNAGGQAFTNTDDENELWYRLHDEEIQ